MIKKILSVFFCFIMCFVFLTAVMAGDNKAERLDTVVNFDGQQLKFTSYDLNGYKYMRICDVAYLLKETPFKYDVEYNTKDKNNMTVILGQGFTPKEGINILANDGEKNPTAKNTKLKINCGNKEYTYNGAVINNQNFIRIRDLSEVVGFKLRWRMYISTLTFNEPVYTLSDFTKNPDDLTSLHQFMTGNYLEFISNKVKDNIKNNDDLQSKLSGKDYSKYIAPFANNYRNFKLTEDSIIFYVDLTKLKIQGWSKIPVSIKYSQLNDFISTNDTVHLSLLMATKEEVNEDSVTNTTIFSNNTVKKTTEYTTETTTSRVDPNKPMVALTFDDGPRKGSTELIVDALKKVDGRATFFVVGTMVEQYPELVKSAVEAGCQIGNHTYSHANLKKLSDYGVKTQVNKCSNLVYDAAGVYPMIGRPPYGSINQTVRNSVSIPWFNWNVDTLDWKNRNADYVYNYVINNVKDGQVILMHDLHPTTAQAMVKAIPKLHEMGYQLVTIDEMAKVKGGYENIPGYVK